MLALRTPVGRRSLAVFGTAVGLVLVLLSMGLGGSRQPGRPGKDVSDGALLLLRAVQAVVISISIKKIRIPRPFLRIADGHAYLDRTIVTRESDEAWPVSTYSGRELWVRICSESRGIDVSPFLEFRKREITYQFSLLELHLVSLSVQENSPIVWLAFHCLKGKDLCRTVTGDRVVPLRMLRKLVCNIDVVQKERSRKGWCCARVIKIQVFALPIVCSQPYQISRSSIETGSHVRIQER